MEIGEHFGVVAHAVLVLSGTVIEQVLSGNQLGYYFDPVSVMVEEMGYSPLEGSVGSASFAYFLGGDHSGSERAVFVRKLAVEVKLELLVIFERVFLVLRDCFFGHFVADIGLSSVSLGVIRRDLTRRAPFSFSGYKLAAILNGLDDSVERDFQNYEPGFGSNRQPTSSGKDKGLVVVVEVLQRTEVLGTLQQRETKRMAGEFGLEFGMGPGDFDIEGR